MTAILSLTVLLMSTIAIAADFSVLEKLVAKSWAPHKVTVKWEPLFGTADELSALANPVPARSPDSTLQGLISLTLDGTAADGTTLRKTFQGHARVFGKVWTVSARIKSGAQISRLHLQETTCEWTGLRAGLLLDGDAIAGKLAVRPLVPGRPILETDIKPKPLILAGHPVTVVYEQNGVVVRVAGVAIKDGAPGDKISVRVPDVAQHRLEGVIQDDATLRWVP